MKLTECKSLLAELDIRPSKRLGQNFLIDSNILDIVVRTAQLGADDVILEVGAGLGVLTSELVARAKFVIAIEKDTRLCRWLKARFAETENLQLLCADALATPLKSGTKPIGIKGDQIHLPDEQFKVVSNLPYSISSALIERFVENRPRPLLMVLTLQREMAQRLAAKPATRDYGALTLFTQLYYHVTVEHIVSPTCFYPSPGVESAVVVFDRRDPKTLLKKGAPFRPIVRAAFSQRRKMLRKMLVQSGFDACRVESALKKLGIAVTARGEELSLDAFIGLANELA